MEGCVDRIKDILEQEKIKIEDEDIDKLSEYVRVCYPDLRKCINEIQKNVIDGQVVFENLVRVKDAFVESVYKIARQGLAIKARKKIIENEHVFSSDYTEMLRSLFNHIYESDVSQETKTEHLVVVSEHLYRAAFVVDPEINFYSCLLALR